MRRPTQELVDAVNSARKIRVDGIVWYKSLRIFVSDMGMPEYKIAAMSRIIRRAEVSLAEENRIRAYFPDLPVLVDPIQEYDTRTHKIVKKVKRAPVKRKRRTTTNFDPDLFKDFQIIRDQLGMSNDEFLTRLIEIHEQ